MGFSVASLLIKLRPGEKRQRGRWRPGWRYQEGPGRGFLFLLAKMSQDPVDDVLGNIASELNHEPNTICPNKLNFTSSSK